MFGAGLEQTLLKFSQLLDDLAFLLKACLVALPVIAICFVLSILPRSVRHVLIIFALVVAAIMTAHVVLESSGDYIVTHYRHWCYSNMGTFLQYGINEYVHAARSISFDPNFLWHSVEYWWMYP